MSECPSGRRVLDRVTISLKFFEQPRPNRTCHEMPGENRQKIYIDTAALCVGSTRRNFVTKVFVDPNRYNIIEIKTTVIPLENRPAAAVPCK